jgi:replication factor A1
MADREDATSFFLVVKATKNFFGSSAHHYMYEKKFSNPFIIMPLMIVKLNKSFIFQLRFGAFKPSSNRCDMVIYKIFDDVL